MNTPPRTLPVLFLVVLILFIAASLKHTSTSTTSPLVGHPNKKTSANSSKPQTPWSLERLKPQFLGGVRQRVEKAEAIWKKTVEQRHKMLEDYTDPNNKDMFPARGAANYAVTPFTIWDFIPASFNCPYEIERIGRLGDGGKWVCGLSRYEKTSKPCIVYSFGIQQESSFEEELLERTKCELWGYDPTVDDFGPQLKSKMKGQGRATFTKAGISGKTDKTQQPPFYSIADLIEMNGHSHVDILKMDIEGFEFEALTSMVEDFQKQDVPISQILIEIHLDVGRKTVDQFLEWWESLETAGYRAAWTEPNLLTVSLPLGDGMPRFAEYSLINVKDGQNLLLS